ncbi:hypothetical protein M5362_27350 [Streptomyces sp. Je 1-79]|uniref:hypothetical protein n=1 Tax=Streptomyces sp. Je 1-79 TaxID=2943847 RepID=UPI0021A8E379|nr:hypothetical protein [Streptomyces sp. Je 1-79]MCT4356842.1 hypothetical protein [Streptomyces sp. Je 1-79]
MDTTTAPATTESASALRLLALGGFLVLFLSLVLTGAAVLEDAIGDDGKAGVAAGAAFWALGLGTLAGLVAAVPPRSALAHDARKWSVALQYGLAVIAPVLALMD